MFSLTQSVPCVYGQPFMLDFILEAEVATGPNTTSTTTGIGSGSADFYNTFVLTGLDPQDLTGDHAVGATFSSESGTEYTIDGVIPEPASGTFLLFGLAGMVIRKRFQS